MAPTVQTPVYTQPPPSLPRHNHTSSLNNSFSQSAVHSFDSSRSVPLTVSATPPPRPPPQSQMSFNMSGNMAGPVPKSNSFSGYGDLNGNPQPSSFYTPDNKPQIYTVSRADPNRFPRSLHDRLYTRMSKCTRWKSTELPSCADDLIIG